MAQTAYAAMWDGEVLPGTVCFGEDAELDVMSDWLWIYESIWLSGELDDAIREHFTRLATPLGVTIERVTISKAEG